LDHRETGTRRKGRIEKAASADDHCVTTTPDNGELNCRKR
jgi:hypothetical protein